MSDIPNIQQINKNLYLIYNTNLYKILNATYINKSVAQNSYRYSSCRNDFIKSNIPYIRRCIHLTLDSDYKAIEAYANRLKQISIRRYADKLELKAIKKLKHLGKYFPELVL